MRHAVPSSPPSPAAPAAPEQGAWIEQAVQPHLRALGRLARRVAGSNDLAADAVQEALVSLWRLGSRPPDVGGWLVRAVCHRSRHLRRTEARRQHYELGAAAGFGAQSVRDPHAIACEREIDAAMAAAVSGLRPEHRDVYVLREHDGLDYQTIARRVAKPLGTVRSRLNRARAALQQELAGALAG